MVSAFQPNVVRLDPFIQTESLEDGELLVKFTIHANSTVLKIFYHFFGILTGGILYLLCYWMPQIYVYLFTSSILNRHVLDSSSSAASSSSLLSQATPKGHYLFICDLIEINRHCTLYVFCQNSWKESKLVKITNLQFNGFVANALPWSPTHSFFLKSIQKQHFNISSLLYFEYRSYRYIFDPLDLKLVPLSNYKDWNWINKSSDYDVLHDQLLPSSTPNVIKHGLLSETAKSKLISLGPNSLNIPKPSLAELMVHEILHPFYIFQLFSIGVWLTENYYFYAFCIFIISLLSSIQNLFDTRRNYDRLEELSKFSCPIQVFRDNIWILVDSDDLVPGDIYKVPLPWSQLYPNTNAFPPCDSILLYGDCIINESPLTGESIPISKQGFLDMKSVDELQQALYTLESPTALSRHLLFSGTRVIQGSVGNNNPNVIAMVIKTGFNSVKGNLVRSMLHPKPHKFKFYQDSFKFIGVMALVALIGFIYTAYNFVLMGESLFIIFLRGLDLITITVPPALPATMSVGISFALRRLRKMDIFCIAPSRINVAGQINILLFDKTGTLTVDGLKLLGAQESKTRLNKAYFNSAVCEQVDELEMNHPLLLCMAGCHDLKLVNNHLLGDPLEIEMFRFTNAQVKPTGIKLGMELIEIYKIFEFDAKLRKMSVIIKINDIYYLCTKGAPEVLLNSFSNTSVPTDFNELLAECSHNGFRVLACGIKTLEMEDLRLSRQQLEVEIGFCGFLIFENKLKLGTTRVIETLNSARIHMAMCTGDNLLTAISVGRECGICVPGPRLIANIRKTSLILQDVVYDNLFGQEDGFVNMDDEMIPSGSYGASIRRQSYNIRQNSGMSSSSSDTSYPQMDTSEPVSPLSTHSQLDVESSLIGGESNFLLFVPFYNNNILEWRSLDVPILKLTKEFEIEITDMSDIQHMQYHFSSKFINNLQKQQRYLERNKQLLDNMQSCFAMDGDTFDYLIQNTPFEALEIYLTKCLIFARMSPDQKADLVERLQKYDFTVGFVGDGIL